MAAIQLFEQIVPQKACFPDPSLSGPAAIDSSPSSYFLPHKNTIPCVPRRLAHVVVDRRRRFQRRDYTPVPRLGWSTQGVTAFALRKLTHKGAHRRSIFRRFPTPSPTTPCGGAKFAQPVGVRLRSLPVARGLQTRLRFLTRPSLHQKVEHNRALASRVPKDLRPISCFSSRKLREEWTKTAAKFRALSPKHRHPGAGVTHQSAFWREFAVNGENLPPSHHRGAFRIGSERWPVPRYRHGQK